MTPRVLDEQAARDKVGDRRVTIGPDMKIGGPLNVPEGVGWTPAVKTPIGLVPANIRKRDRGEEILDAMRRYIGAGRAIPQIWLEELKETYGE